MKFKLVKTLLFILSLLPLLVLGQDTIPTVVTLPSHPRLLLLQNEEMRIQNSIQNSTLLNKVHQNIIAECDAIIAKPPVERIVIGFRLLDKSRECLKRVFYLSYAWRLTQQQKYLDRAEDELLAVCAFQDWNPVHFLDVAEMTIAVSIGYDWLYNDLSDSTRTILKTAIYEKGLLPSLPSSNNSWINTDTNWNQVCNAGMTFGALAVFEDYPAIARTIINRAIKSIPKPLAVYNPDGAYPEGYSYWAYGTGFNVLFFDALQQNFNSNFNLLSPTSSFFKTPYYVENMTGTTGFPFNYSDCGINKELQPAMFWFANKLTDPSLLWVEQNKLQNFAASQLLNERLLPSILIWGSLLDMNTISAPQSNIWVGNGKSPVALMRTSWTDSTGIFVGFKAGSPSVNHSHMDIGSFILEAGGERWAIDLGAEDYNKLESNGLNIWSQDQNSQRWDVFRYNNKAHNTLTINNELQLVTGFSSIQSYSSNPDDLSATTDLSSLYSNSVTSVKRKISIANKTRVILSDTINTSANSATVKWTLVTDADVSRNGSTVILTKKGKKLIIKVNQPANVSVTKSPAKSSNAYDSSNGSASLVCFELLLTPQAQHVIEVTFEILPIELWPQQKFTEGNFVVLRSGDGAGVMNTNKAAKATLFEVTASGNLPSKDVSIDLSPEIGEGLFINGISEGCLNRSVDGKYLTFNAFKTTNFAAIAAGTAENIFPTVDHEGTVNTDTRFTYSGLAGNGIRAVSTYDGSKFWFSTNTNTTPSNGVLSVDANNSVGTNPIPIYIPLTRGLGVFGSKIYAYGGTGGVAVIQDGFIDPASPGAAATRVILPGAPANYNGESTTNILFLDTDPNVNWNNTGFDLLYTSDNSTGASPGLYKYYFNGSSWVAAGSIQAAFSATVAKRGIQSFAGRRDSTNNNIDFVAIVGTQSSAATVNNKLVYFTDNTSRTGNISSVAVNDGISAGTNYSFRGIALAPAQNSVFSLEKLNFSGSANGDKTNLKWIIEDYKQIDGFVIEKSPDGQHYTEVKKIPAKNDSGKQIYNADDYNSGSNDTHYRLKITDNSGKYNYSNTIIIKSMSNKPLITLFPNPAKEKITIIFPKTSRSTTFSIRTTYGKQVGKYLSKPGDTKLELDVAALPLGIYFITTTESKEAMRFVKE